VCSSDLPKGFSQKAHCQGKKKKIETKEATSSSSSGSYVTPAAWSKSMSKKDWRGASKTQIPGGKFVQVKKKCTKFPYCNQGDIKALKLFENKLVDDVINKISKENNISKSVIKLALFEHFKKINKNKSN
jgi:ribosome assembly protein YihI (activator of Der GTPase)